MQKVRPKKHLGQHFLKDESLAKDITLLANKSRNFRKILEIGPGMGVLTQFLVERSDLDLYLVELDRESVEFLKNKYPENCQNLFSEDFLKMNLVEKLQLSENESFGIIGNFPYNISSQIFFKVLEIRDCVEEVVCMLQKEVAKRIASKPKNKDYGILSVLLQAFYDIEYNFTVLPDAFNPPPKVDSGVISLKRNRSRELGCEYKKFHLVVKTAFNQRRKTLRNALKPLGVHFESHLLDLRAEALDYTQFVELTNLIFKGS